jgi:hypothetical protein
MIVTLDALFSSSNKIGGKIISYGTAHLAPSVKEKVSHAALLVNGRWVHESTGKSGVAVISYEKWSGIHKETARIPLSNRPYQELADIYRSMSGKKYDYLGILFFAIAILPTFLGFKLYSKNLLESRNKYFCSEALGKLIGRYYSMHSPVQIQEELERERR